MASFKALLLGELARLVARGVVAGVRKVGDWIEGVEEAEPQPLTHAETEHIRRQIAAGVAHKVKLHPAPPPRRAR